MSKGSRQRPLSIPKKQFDKNWERIFGQGKKINRKNQRKG